MCLMADYDSQSPWQENKPKTTQKGNSEGQPEPQTAFHAPCPKLQGQALKDSSASFLFFFLYLESGQSKSESGINLQPFY